MRKLLLLPIIILFLGCSDEEFYYEDCECVKTTYFYKDLSETFIMNVEDVACQDEVFKKWSYGNVYFNVECNK
jgi:hypothetical protein